MTGKLHSYEMYVKKKIISLLCAFFCIYLFINVCELYIYLLDILGIVDFGRERCDNVYF